MIRDQLQPIDIGINISTEEIAQALAYTCLSYYPTVPLEPRVHDSFKKAFAHDSLVRVAQVSPVLAPVKPAWLAAIFISGETRRVLIAVQGCTALGQIFNAGGGTLTLSGPFGMDTLTGRQGNVWSGFYNHANSLWADISAHPVIAAELATPRTIFTFTGSNPVSP